MALHYDIFVGALADITAQVKDPKTEGEFALERLAASNIIAAGEIRRAFQLNDRQSPSSKREEVLLRPLEDFKGRFSRPGFIYRAASAISEYSFERELKDCGFDFNRNKWDWGIHRQIPDYIGVNSEGHFIVLDDQFSVAVNRLRDYIFTTTKSLCLGEILQLDPEVLKKEIRNFGDKTLAELQLVAAENGLELPLRLDEETRDFLRKNGKLILDEILPTNPAQRELLRNGFREGHLYRRCLIVDSDLNGGNRRYFLGPIIRVSHDEYILHKSEGMPAYSGYFGRWE